MGGRIDLTKRKSLGNRRHHIRFQVVLLWVFEGVSAQRTMHVLISRRYCQTMGTGDKDINGSEMTANFMLEDIERTLLAMLFCPFVFYCPGYVLARVADILEFKEQNIGVKSLLALCLSIAIYPTIVFIGGLIVGLKVILVLYGLIALWFVWNIISDFRQVKRVSNSNGESKGFLARYRFGILACLLWFVIAVLSLIDWQPGPEDLFPPVEVHDYTKHIVVTDAITRTGVPPVSPMFCPSDAPKLFYYYYWFMLCSLVEQCSGGLLHPREAVLAGDVFTGFALLAAIALATRFLLPAAKDDRWQTAKIACLLTLATGLDLLPVGLSHVMMAAKHELPIFASVEWWNDYIESFTHFAIWVPHHVAGFVSCVIGTIILRRFQETGEKPLTMLILASLAFASAIGLSIYVSVTFAAGWVLWSLICIKTKIEGRIAQVTIAGVLSALMSVPLIATLIQANHSHARQIALTIRPFLFGEALVNQVIPRALVNKWIIALEHLAFLPLNYGMEFGFFALGTYLYFRTRDKFSSQDWFLLTLFAASLLIATFLRSAVRNNDLGIRSVSVAQLAMLLWSARLVWEHFTQKLARPMSRRQINLLGALLVTGVAGVLYDLLILRFAQQIGMRRAYDAGVQDGTRNFYARDMYEKLDKMLKRDSKIQHNPIETLEPYDGSYGRRQVVLFDRHYGTLMGISPEMYGPVEADIGKIFSAGSPEEVEAIAGKYGIDALIVKENDPVWKDPNSWVYKKTPDYQNKAARLYILNPAKRS
jgi:hypothetical protein